MNFGLDHYVPALKLKTAEKAALKALKPEVRNRITPLLQMIELVEGVTLKERLASAFDGLPAAVAGLARFFIDPMELTDGIDREPAAAAANAVFESCASLETPFTPVSGVSRQNEVTTAALRAQKRSGFALRVTPADLSDGLGREVLRFLRAHQLSASETDLILDHGPLEDELIDLGLTREFYRSVTSLPLLSEWRTVTLLSSAFPYSLKDLSNGHRAADRSNWRVWRDHTRRTPAIVRTPTFGDWGIQHPQRKEPKPGAPMNIFGNIRYAQEAQWLINRGVSQDDVPLALQMPRLAAPFASGELAGPFDREHCAGCRSIAAVASGTEIIALAATWREIGTIHHITTTVEAIRSLRAT